MEDPQIKVALIPSLKAEPPSSENKQKTVPAAKTKPVPENQLLVAILGSCGVTLWIVFFSLGMLINSSIYTKPLLTGFNWHDFIMAVITFTPSNIAILCLVASFTGGCASLLVIQKVQKKLGLEQQTNLKRTNSHIYMSENPFSSMMRGILVFFAFLAGVVVSSSTVFVNPTQQTYTQAAGVVSMFAFLVGYDPSMFLAFINLTEKANSGEKTNSDDSSQKN
jgi:hypothetical protein